MADIDLSSVRTPALVRNLNDMRSSGCLTDVILHVDGMSFPAHRNFLAAGSPYFMAMFTKGLKEARKKEVPIYGVSQEAMVHVLDFIYTGKVSLTSDCYKTVQDLVQASDLFQIVDLHRVCEEWLVKRVVPANCISLYLLARTYNCRELAQAAQWTLVSDFTDVSKGSEFLDLELSQVTELVSDESLVVHEGAGIFDALERWAKHNDTCGDGVGEVMKHARCHTLELLCSRQKMSGNQVLRGIAPATEVYKTAAQGQVDLKNAVGVMRDPKSFGLISSLRFGTRRPDIIVSACKSRDCDGLQLYETQTKTKYRLPTPYLATKVSIIVSQDNKLYVAGGVLKDSTVKDLGTNVKVMTSANFYVYDSLHSRWWEKAPMYISRFDFALASGGKHVYAIGGKSSPDGQALSDVERYDPEENTWHMMAQLPCGLSGHHAVTIDRDIYVLCGFDSPRGKDVFCYQMLTNTWTNVAPMPAVKKIHGAAAVGGKIYTVLSSWKNSSWTPTTMAMYNPQTDKWEKDENFLPEEVEVAVGPAAVEDRLYLCCTEGLYVLQPTGFPCPLDQWSLHDKNVLPPSGQSGFHVRAGCVHIDVDGLDVIA
ncbi:kelch repeat and BTB domain-containing protein 8-like [Branchiostoma floridae x Branchiostoma belcheri]